MAPVFTGYSNDHFLRRYGSSPMHLVVERDPDMANHSASRSATGGVWGGSLCGTLINYSRHGRAYDPSLKQQVCKKCAKSYQKLEG